MSKYIQSNTPIDFSKNDGLVPAVIQDSSTGVVLMLGYMNSAALEKTQNEGIVTFFSRSKQRLWTKGETSGNVLRVQEILIDCDADTLLIKADPAGPTCHTGAATCFNEANSSFHAPQSGEKHDTFLHILEQIVLERKQHPFAESYTSKLFAKGINKIAQKVGEEAVELVIEAKDSNDDLFVGEAADLLFHTLVLFAAKGIALDDVLARLRERHAQKTQ